MTRSQLRQLLFHHWVIAALFLPAACHGQDANSSNAQANIVATTPAARLPASTSNDDAAVPVATPLNEGNTGTITGGGFQPLGSQAVKDAIHRALNTGTTQRWQDGSFAGYAVPSQTADIHGCRSVRYTVDQQPQSSYPVITACDANRPQ